MADRRLSDLVSVRGRFHRSVNLSRDWSGGRDFSEYVVTTGIRGIADEILGELSRPGGTRAWSLTGAYGTGKSAFSLFLSDVLAAERPSRSEGKKLRAKLGKKAKPFVPLLIQAERAELLPLILQALEQAAKDLKSPVVKKIRAERRKRRPSGESIVRLLEGLAADTIERGKGGLALFVDEFGKFLEYASSDPTRGDIFALQQIAECAARSEVPILFITVLHSGFSDYLSGDDEVVKAEWQKVQGRFRDVPFQLPADQLISLIQHALDTKFRNGIEKAYFSEVDGIVSAGALKDGFGRPELREMLRDCAPLHPAVALLLWPLFRSKVAQNERSLFAFLTSYEPFGFQEFLARELASPENAPLYGLPELYDYVASALGSSAFTGTDGRRWALIDHALARISSGSTQRAKDLIKSIGLLNQYGEQVGLKASPDALQAIWGGIPEVLEELDSLKQQSILIYRRHNDTYSLWEGSDLDLEETFQSALAQVGGRPLHERFERTLSLSPVVARAHYVESGTLRFFDSCFAPADTDAIDQALDAETIADGSLVFLVGEREIDDDLARELSKKASTKRTTLLASPRVGAELVKSLQNFECWEWVRNQVPELHGDAVARQEVVARLRAARAKLEQLAGPVFGLSGHALNPALSDWFVNGRKRESGLRSSRDLQKFLSANCAKDFEDAPELRNELLNRHNLSAAGARARRNLLERMLLNADEEKLGMTGFPAEFSMYCAMLKEGGFHKKVKGKWQLKSPEKTGGWAAAWGEVESFLQKARTSRQPLVDLMESLKQKPLGLRDGPIPVLVTHALIVAGDEIAIYEDGMFLPSLTVEALERFLRRPETFEVQSYRLKASERRVLASLRNLDEIESTGSDSEIVSVVRGLVKVAASLPPYTRQTRRLEEKTTSVRDALLNAKDPKALLFEDLPSAVHVDLKRKDASQKLTEAIAAELKALLRSYPNLLDRIESLLREKFKLQKGKGAAIAELKERSDPLVPFASEEKLQVFVREASRASGDRDWREVLGRAVNGGKPVDYWQDHDEDSLPAKLDSIASDFVRVESLVREQGGTHTKVVGFEILGAGRAVISCTEELEERARDLVDGIEKALPEGADLDAALVALAEVALRAQQRKADRERTKGD